MIKRKDIVFALIILLFPLVPSFFLSGSIVIKDQNLPNDPYRKKISEINVDDVLWIDPRKRGKYEEKHIPKALWINSKNWEEALAQIFEVFEPGQTIVVYCNKGCAESKSVAERLRNELDQDNIYYLEGGVNSWFTNTPH